MMVAWIKKYFQSSRRQAEILAETRRLVAEMEGEHWAQEVGKSDVELREALMNIGLAYIRMAKAGQDLGKKMAEGIKEARWAPVQEAHRN